MERSPETWPSLRTLALLQATTETSVLQTPPCPHSLRRTSSPTTEGLCEGQRAVSRSRLSFSCHHPGEGPPHIGEASASTETCQAWTLSHKHSGLAKPLLVASKLRIWALSTPASQGTLPSCNCKTKTSGEHCLVGNGERICQQINGLSQSN